MTVIWTFHAIYSSFQLSPLTRQRWEKKNMRCLHVNLHSFAALLAEIYFCAKCKGKGKGKGTLRFWLKIE